MEDFHVREVPFEDLNNERPPAFANGQSRESLDRSYPRPVDDSMEIIL